MAEGNQELSADVVALGEAWEAALVAFHARFADCFVRSEPRTRSRAYLHGLLSPVARKNGWQLAEALGEDDPIGVQRLLYEAVWDAAVVLARYQTFVAETFGDPQAVLVLDETGFVKKGTQSVGVQRQYSGTTGKVENCQIGVFLAYVSPTGHVLCDRRLYLPQSWAEDPPRRAQAKVPAAVTFQTTPALGLAMLAQARAAGLPHAWVTADERYGSDPKFLATLEGWGEAYVVAVPSTTPAWAAGATVVAGPAGVQVLTADTPTPLPVATHVAAWADSRWQRLSVGDGTKGPRVYDWGAVRVVVSREQWPGPTLWLLARRSVTHPAEIAYYLADAPADTPVAVLAQVAGRRWPVEQCFEEAKGETGLDQYEVRTWPSWHRHITLSMMAHGFLAWQRREVGEKGGPGHGPGLGGSECAGTAALTAGPAALAAPVPRLSSGVVALAPPSPSPRPPGALCPFRSRPLPPYLRL